MAFLPQGMQAAWMAQRTPLFRLACSMPALRDARNLPMANMSRGLTIIGTRPAGWFAIPMLQLFLE